MVCWIKKTRPNLPVYVHNRIAEIRELSSDSEWVYVETKANAANLVSRELLPTELLKSDLWWNGSAFCRSCIADEPIVDEIDHFFEASVAVKAMAAGTTPCDRL